MRFRWAMMLATLAASSLACSQGGFTVHFDNEQAGLSGVGTSIRQVPSGFLSFARQFSQEFPTQTHILVRRLNENGIVQGGSDYLLGDDRDFDIGYIDPVCGLVNGSLAATITEGYGYESEKHLYVFTITGDTLSRELVTTYPPLDSVVHLVRQTRRTSDYGYALVGAFDPIDAYSKVLLMRLDQDGDTLWTKTYGAATEGPVGLGVAEYTDGGFLLTGYGTPLGSVNKSFLIRTDANGNQVWRRNYGNRATAVNGAVRVAADGGIVTWSAYREPQWPTDWQQMMLRRWDANGTVVWEERNHYNYYTATYDFEILPDGSMVACGTALLEAVIAKFSASGDSLWSRSYAPTHGGSYLYDVEPTSDGGFVATGSTDRYDPIDTSFQTNQVIWVVKTDSLGCVVPGCQNVGVQEYALDMNEYLSVWPNPASVQINFSFAPPQELALAGPLRATLLDATGRTVREELLPVGGTVFSLPVVELPAGAYHLHLSDGRRWLAGKTVVKE